MGEGWCHSSAFALEGFDFLGQGRVREKLEEGEQVTVVVIGGGSVWY